MDTTSLKEKSLKTLTRAMQVITFFLKNTLYLFSKRDFAIIAFFTILGIGGVFAAGRVVLTPTESQGAGYSAVTACDPNVTINKDITFDLTLSRYVISTISITDVNQSYISGCGNQIMELALPLNGGVTYASWTIPSSTFTNGVFTFGASDSSTGITYRAYTTLNPIDVEYSFASAAINTRASARAVTNGPVYDLLKDNGFTTVGQDASSNKITFALSLSCGTLTVDTTQPGVSAALTALTAPTGYVKNNGTSTGVNGVTTAATLGYRGYVADINIVLPWISYAWKSDCTTTTPTFQGAIWDAQPTGVSSPIAWNFSENGHYYQYVSTTKSWADAYTEITGLTPSTTSTPSELPSTTRAQSACYYRIYDLCGYFATVQTAGENAFITSKVGLSGAWLGGNMRTTRLSSKTFKWIDPVAPEYNAVFSAGQTNDGTGWNPASLYSKAVSYTVNGNTYRYENWNNGEPNNYSHSNSCGSGCNGEQALQIVAGGNGYWNDYPEVGANLGYIIEYGDSTAFGESLVGGGSKTGVITWHY
jgi:hypothetical protein